MHLLVASEAHRGRVVASAVGHTFLHETHEHGKLRVRGMVAVRAKGRDGEGRGGGRLVDFYGSMHCGTDEWRRRRRRKEDANALSSC